MRDAECALDQLISFCGSQIVEEDVLSMFGLTAQRQILALSRALLTANSEAALRELDELAKHGKDLSRLLADLLYHLRNLLIFQLSKGDLKLLEVSEAEAASLKEEATLINTDGLTRIMDVLTDSESRLRDAASKKIFIEVALLKAIQARSAVSIDTLIGQLQQWRSAGVPAATTQTRASQTTAAAPSENRTAPAPAPAQPEPVASRITAQPAEAAAIDPNLYQLWQGLLDAVGRASAFTRSYLLEAHPVSFTGDVLTIGFDPEFSDQMELVNNARTHALLQTKLKELGHASSQIKFIKAEGPVARPIEKPVAEPVAAAQPTPAPAVATAKREKPSPASINTEEFKNDPLIQKALEVFKGQIVEVRS